MPTKKRPYVRKTRGCHECSQRRINCDRNEPGCRKCSQKGLKCSGLGVRHRFNNGVAARGRWAGMSMESVFQVKQREQINAMSSPKSDPTVAETDGNAIEETAQVATPYDFNSTISPTPPWDLLDALPGAVEIEDFTNENDANMFINEHNIYDLVLFQPAPDDVSREGRHLLLHCKLPEFSALAHLLMSPITVSEHIATEMIAFDGFHNGWRHLILPLAQTDHLVLNAVLAAAEAHQQISQEIFPSGSIQENRSTLWHPTSSQLYARAIQGLRERQELVRGDQASKRSVATTILVLLSAVMVTACSDFPVLIRMLESAVLAMGGREGLGEGEFTDFILRQVNKMRVYAAPLLGEQTGVEIISSRAQTARLLDCLNYSVQQIPEQAAVSKQVANLVDQARDIYLHQVFSELEPSCPLGTSTLDSICRVQRFKETLEALASDSPAQKVLVWATFVAASDCRLDEHKGFFEGVLTRHYARSGFRNVLKGLESLRRMWARDPGERWTSMLPEGKVLVM